jgi:hypothetical protein
VSVLKERTQGKPDPLENSYFLVRFERTHRKITEPTEKFTHSLVGFVRTHREITEPIGNSHFLVGLK